MENYAAGYGLAAQLGTVQVDRCRVANNLYGMSMQDCVDFSAQNCDFSSNLEFGLVVKGKANLQNCRFDGNKNGLQLNQTNDTQVQLTNTTISNSQQYGVQAVDSQFGFDASTAAKWRLTANGHGIAGLRSTLTFSGFTLGGQIAPRCTPPTVGSASAVRPFPATGSASVRTKTPNSPPPIPISAATLSGVFI